MRSCQIVVSTCAFGGGDNLYQLIGMSKASTQKVCHSDSLELFLFLNTSLVLLLNYSVCGIHSYVEVFLLWIQVCYVTFWDDVTHATQEAEGHKIGENSLLIKSWIISKVSLKQKATFHKPL